MKTDNKVVNKIEDLTKECLSKRLASAIAVDMKLEEPVKKLEKKTTEVKPEDPMC